MLWFVVWQWNNIFVIELFWSFVVYVFGQIWNKHIISLTFAEVKAAKPHYYTLKYYVTTSKSCIQNAYFGFYKKKTRPIKKIN